MPKKRRLYRGGLPDLCHRRTDPLQARERSQGVGLATHAGKRSWWTAFFTLVLAAVTLSPILRAQQKAPGAVETQEEWLGMYWGKKKTGYTSTRVEPTTFQGRPAILETSRTNIKLAMLGGTVELDETEVTVSDTQYRPLTETFDVKSGGSALHVDAVFDYAAHRIDCVIGTGSAATKKTLSIPSDANLAGDPNLLTRGQTLSVGQKLSFLYLEPLTVSLDSAKVEVTGHEKIHDGSDKEVDAYVVRVDMSEEGKMTIWTTESGDTIKGDADVGGVHLAMVKETKAQSEDMAFISASVTVPGAKDTGATLPSDFAVATAVTTDRPIENARRLRSLHLTITGIPAKKLLLSDSRQKEQVMPTADPATGYTVKVAIHAAPFDAAQSGRLPVTDPDLDSYLQKAAYLDTDDPEIRRTAADLRGKETNLFRIATRIRDWVHIHMTPDPSAGVPRSAEDIYHKRHGVCRDYATLYTALARAAGVPTRLCGGIVYADGKFFYHAWAESYVGQWVAFDPTLYDPAHPVDYVDATHIKFAQGDVTSMFDVVEVVGRLHITVQEATL